MLKNTRTFLSRCLLALAILVPALIRAEDETGADPGVHWDLTELFPTPEAWTEKAARVRAALPHLATYEGTLGQGAERLQALMDESDSLYKAIGRLYVYATLAADVDVADATNAERRSMAEQLETDYQSAMSFLGPELLELGSDRVQTYLHRNAGLADYRFTIEEILRAAPHTLGKEAEAVLAASAAATDGRDNVHSVLSNSDIPWPKVTLQDGTEITVDQAGFRKYRQAPDREDRKAVFEAFFTTYRQFESTYGQNYAGKVKSDIFYANARKYDTSLERALDAANIPTAVYHTLLAEVNASLPTLHRYFTLRGRMLGIDQPHYYDIYPDMVTLDKDFGLAQGKQIVVAATAPLGEEYVTKVTHALNSPWTDYYPKPGKRSGAYMFGWAYDVHPYVLMNYQDDYDSVSTLAHEWGHGMHSILASEAQPFATAGYATFTAEIASVVNEVLLLEHMLANAESDDEKLYYLGSALEGMRGTFFRQAMFAEFELRTHELVESGGAISGGKMTDMYLELVRRYHGHDEGVLTVDDYIGLEWAYIPHFYRNFYVFQYATSMAAANLFADMVLTGDPQKVDTYLDLLRAGGSDHPYEIVKRAGVDLATPTPYRSTVARMNAIMDQMEAILAAQGR